MQPDPEFISGGFRWESSNVKIAADVPPELLEVQQPPARRGQKPVVQGIPVPPLNLKAKGMQQQPALDPWEHAELHQQPGGGSSSRPPGGGAAGVPPLPPSARTGTPPRTPRTPGGGGGGGNTARSGVSGSARGDPQHGPSAGLGTPGSRSGSRGRQRYGAWYLPPKEWANMLGADGAAGAAVAGGSRGGSPRRGADDATGADAGAGLEHLDHRAVELGASYTARVYKGYLAAQGLRPPAALERAGTPTEEQIQARQMEIARAEQLKREQARRNAAEAGLRGAGGGGGSGGGSSRLVLEGIFSGRAAALDTQAAGGGPQSSKNISGARPWPASGSSPRRDIIPVSPPPPPPPPPAAAPATPAAPTPAAVAAQAASASPTDSSQAAARGSATQVAGAFASSTSTDGGGEGPADAAEARPAAASAQPSLGATATGAETEGGEAAAATAAVKAGAFPAAADRPASQESTVTDSSYNNGSDDYYTSAAAAAASIGAGVELSAASLTLSAMVAMTAAVAATAQVPRGSDWVEGIDDVMAPALRDKIRQMLGAQDAMLAHRARMRAYEQERARRLRITGGGGGLTDSDVRALLNMPSRQGRRDAAAAGAGATTMSGQAPDSGAATGTQPLASEPSSPSTLRPLTSCRSPKRVQLFTGSDVADEDGSEQPAEPRSPSAMGGGGRGSRGGGTLLLPKSSSSVFGLAGSRLPAAPSRNAAAARRVALGAALPAQPGVLTPTAVLEQARRRMRALPGNLGDLTALQMLVEKLPNTVRAEHGTDRPRTSVNGPPTARTSPPPCARSASGRYGHVLPPRAASPISSLAARGGGGSAATSSAWGEAVAHAALAGFPSGAAAALLAGTAPGPGGSPPRQARTRAASPLGQRTRSPSPTNLAAASAAAAVNVGVGRSRSSSPPPFSKEPSMAVLLPPAAALPHTLLAPPQPAASRSYGGGGGGGGPGGGGSESEMPLAVQVMMEMVPGGRGAGNDNGGGGYGGLGLSSSMTSLAPLKHMSRSARQLCASDGAAVYSLRASAAGNLAASGGTGGAARARSGDGRRSQPAPPLDAQSLRAAAATVFAPSTPELDAAIQLAADAVLAALGREASDLLAGKARPGQHQGDWTAAWENSGSNRDADAAAVAADAASKLLRGRFQLPPENSLPARLTGAAVTARDGGGAHSFAPGQVAAFVGGADAAPVQTNPPPAPPAVSAALKGVLSNAQLPGLPSDRNYFAISAASSSGRTQAPPPSGPAADLYALGLLPNPSLMRCAMATPAAGSGGGRRKGAGAAGNGGGSGAGSRGGSGGAAARGGPQVLPLQALPAGHKLPPAGFSSSLPASPHLRHYHPHHPHLQPIAVQQHHQQLLLQARSAAGATLSSTADSATFASASWAAPASPSHAPWGLLPAAAAPDLFVPTPASTASVGLIPSPTRQPPSHLLHSHGHHYHHHHHHPPDPAAAAASPAGDNSLSGGDFSQHGQPLPFPIPPGVLAVPASPSFSAASYSYSAPASPAAGTPGSAMSAGHSRSPQPLAFAHTAPHAAPGSPTRRADAAEAAAMAARSRLGRSGPLDLQHMLGVEVPPRILQAR
ncbi:hypothetical protein HYH02_000721 [Chlamydomonas schloesseri]|uniref:Uncharacterized protein n=1 Tax=Chlamydomonas schloesseri TaxID=2026947 RepID=A0A835WZ19_9CHLO|nr:hypothetical protein HYH02_000721 [Chlamydomonas schloesseri]|eukprot:KAG2454890.1 hypothetical protein HYH02_000721 [Chlamydomonas schloesseri]